MDEFELVAQQAETTFRNYFNQFVSNLRFSPLDDDDMRKFDNGGGHFNMDTWRSQCEWADDFMNSPEEALWLYGSNNPTQPYIPVSERSQYSNPPDNNPVIYGVCMISPMAETIQTPSGHNISFVYVQLRCAVLPIINHPYITSGKLLWSCILHHIYNNSDSFNITRGNYIVVYNHAISEAKGYHIKMGMLPLANTPLNSIRPQIKNLNEINYNNDNVINELLDADVNSPDSSYLFYIFRNDVNYYDLFDIYQSIELGSKDFTAPIVDDVQLMEQ
jgi:hypothetical protein